MPRRFVQLFIVVFVLACLAYIRYDYFNSFDVIDAKLVKILDDKEKPDRHILAFSTVSNYPAYFFISNKIRRFFYLQPTLCFVTPDGKELEDEYVVTPCFDQEQVSKKRGKLHEVEKSEFFIPFYTTPDKFDLTQLHYKTIVKQHGIWIKLTLIGYMVPPPVDSKPVFVSFDPYCKTQADQCHRIFGW